MRVGGRVVVVSFHDVSDYLTCTQENSNAVIKFQGRLVQGCDSLMWRNGVRFMSASMSCTDQYIGSHWELPLDPCTRLPMLAAHG
jgi:hypothetical protein